MAAGRGSNRGRLPYQGSSDVPDATPAVRSISLRYDRCVTYRPRARCKRCETPRGLAGGLSRTGLCSPCGEQVLADALRQVAQRSGPVYERYRAGMTDYVASLWGGSDIPDTPGVLSETIPLFEVTP